MVLIVFIISLKKSFFRSKNVDLYQYGRAKLWPYPYGSAKLRPIQEIFFVSKIKLFFVNPLSVSMFSNDNIFRRAIWTLYLG